MLVKTLAVVASLLVFLGCVTRGKDFSSDLRWIKKDNTSQGDVTSILGTPYKVGSSSGIPTWTYGFYKFKLFGESWTKELKLYWNNSKLVRDFSFSSSFPEDRKKVLNIKK